MVHAKFPSQVIGSVWLFQPYTTIQAGHLHCHYAESWKSSPLSEAMLKFHEITQFAYRFRKHYSCLKGICLCLLVGAIVRENPSK